MQTALYACLWVNWTLSGALQCCLYQSYELQQLFQEASPFLRLPAVPPLSITTKAKEIQAQNVCHLPYSTSADTAKVNGDNDQGANTKSSATSRKVLHHYQRCQRCTTGLLPEVEDKPIPAPTDDNLPHGDSKPSLKDRSNFVTVPKKRLRIKTAASPFATPNLFSALHSCVSKQIQSTGNGFQKPRVRKHERQYRCKKGCEFCRSLPPQRHEICQFQLIPPPSHTWNAESAKAEPQQSANLNYAKSDGPSPADALIELPPSPTGVTESELRGCSSSNSSSATSAETSLPTTKNEVSSPTSSANESSPGPQRLC